MIYITTRQSPGYHQMSLEELLFSTEVCVELPYDKTSTRTYEVENISQKFKCASNINPQLLLNTLHAFNMETEELRKKDRHSLYRTFFIPKHTGGLRRIDAPCDELMTALRKLKTIFEDEFGVLYHTSAFAYIPGRSTIDAVRKHQQNQSKWFAKMDLSDFFGSTTLDFVMYMLSMIFPFTEIIELPNGKDELKKSLSLAFLNGGLPQGTPISPLITNIMMIPIDFTLSKKLRNFNKNNYIYTRYADDFIISSKYSFNFNQIETVIRDTLKEFNAPFCLNQRKTRYGSSSGSNWNLGVMLNKDNQITIGYKNKRVFKAMITSYIQDRIHSNSVVWSLSDLQTLAGYHSYYRMVERDEIDKIMFRLSNKFGIDILSQLKSDLKTAQYN